MTDGFRCPFPLEMRVKTGWFQISDYFDQNANVAGSDSSLSDAS